MSAGTLGAAARTYTLRTTDDVAFSVYPPVGEGGPNLVGNGGWDVRFRRVRPGDPTVTVQALHWAGPDDPEPQRHALNGTKWPTLRQAQRAAYRAGLLAFLVHDHASSPAPDRSTPTRQPRRR